MLQYTYWERGNCHQLRALKSNGNEVILATLLGSSPPVPTQSIKKWLVFQDRNVLGSHSLVGDLEQ